MLTTQHIALIRLNEQKWADDQFVGGVVFPDAIRAYSGPRQYSHYEYSDDGTDCSWWIMPTNMATVTRESVQASLKDGSHLAANKKAPFGQETNWVSFVSHNSDMALENPSMFKGVMTHLKNQDVVFDRFIRERVIDVSRMSEGIVGVQDTFLRRGRIPEGVKIKQSNGKAVFASDQDARAAVTAVEQFGIYVLAERLYRQCGVTASTEWFQTTVREKLARVYPTELVESSVSYMKVANPFNAWIEQHDFSHTNYGPLSKEDYDALYDECFF